MGEGTWVAVECHYRCGACRRRAPLNHLDFDGEVQCLCCGATEPFDIAQWIDAIEFARGVHERASHGSDEIDPDSIRRHTLVTQAEPGHPPCPGCASPLVIERCTAGLLRVGCGACDYRGTFVLPRGIRQSVPSVGGVFASGHAKDLDVVEIESSSEGTSVLRCPQCTAPLHSARDAGVVRCEFCRATVRVSWQALRAAGHDPEPERWFLYFP